LKAAAAAAYVTSVLSAGEKSGQPDQVFDHAGQRHAAMSALNEEREGEVVSYLRGIELDAKREKKAIDIVTVVI